MLIIIKATGKVYPEKYEWGKEAFWNKEASNILEKRGLSLVSVGGIRQVLIGNSSEPVTTIEFNNGVEIYAENQSPPWAKEENDKILGNN